jgi:gliding motility-associated-like protein
MPYKQDGINNFFKVYAEDAAEFISVNVFDRWGAKVYSSLDINESWNGFFQGQKLAQGVYTYIVKARCEVTNEIFHFAGDVTIIE